MPEQEIREHRGGCSCGWRGPWRTTNTDANLDIQQHFREIQHTGTSSVEFDDDSLMPFERAKGSK